MGTRLFTYNVVLLSNIARVSKQGKESKKLKVITIQHLKVLPIALAGGCITSYFENADYCSSDSAQHSMQIIFINQ